MARARTHFPTRTLARWIALVITAAVGFASARPACAADAGDSWTWSPFEPCPGCSVFLGSGATFNYFQWTDGVLVPLTLELDDSRWELGAFRFTTRQLLKGSHPDAPATISANPYWGFSAMRRWQLLHREWWRLYVGFGASYRNETDLLVATHWNSSYLLGMRFDLGSDNHELEIAARHWSNAWVRLPDRGQTFLTISFSF